MRDLYDTFVNECTKAEETFRDVYTSAYTDRSNRINQALQVMVDAMSERLRVLAGEEPNHAPKTLKHEEQPPYRREAREARNIDPYTRRLDDILQAEQAEKQAAMKAEQDDYREQQAEKQAQLKRLNEEQAMQSRAGTVGIVALENEFRANRIE